MAKTPGRLSLGGGPAPYKTKKLSRHRKTSNSKFNCSETEKRPEKYIGGPAGWEKVGPLPLLFSTATPSTFFGSLFGSLRNGNAIKKKK
jgi:hypothetical protein